MEYKKEPLCVQNKAVPFCIACYISAVSTSAHRGRVTMLSRVVRTTDPAANCSSWPN